MVRIVICPKLQCVNNLLQRDCEYCAAQEEKQIRFFLNRGTQFLLEKCENFNHFEIIYGFISFLKFQFNF